MPPLSHPLHLVLGFVVWSAFFVVMYGGLSVACAVAPPAAAMGSHTWLNLTLLVLTLATTLLLLQLAVRCRRAANGKTGQQHFVHRVAAGLYLAAALSTLAIGLPVAVLPPCP